METKNVLIVEDHDIAIDNLKRITKRVIKEVNIYTAKCSDFAIDIIKKSDKLDLLISDLSLPKSVEKLKEGSSHEGFRIIEEARKKFPKIKTVVFTQHHECEIITRLFFNNINGILQKGNSITELSKGIEAVVNGKNYECETIKSITVNIARTNPKKIFSMRYIQILKLLSNGLINKQIADVLSLSERTIEDYKSKMFKCLDAKTTVELYKKAIH